MKTAPESSGPDPDFVPTVRSIDPWDDPEPDDPFGDGFPSGYFDDEGDR